MAQYRRPQATPSRFRRYDEMRLLDWIEATGGSDVHAALQRHHHTRRRGRLALAGLAGEIFVRTPPGSFSRFRRSRLEWVDTCALRLWALRGNELKIIDTPSPQLSQPGTLLFAGDA